MGKARRVLLMIGAALSTAAAADDTTVAKPNLQVKPDYIPLKLMPVPWVKAFTTPLNDMTGWTQLTSGASKGGPTVAQIHAGRTLLVVRGADDGLYQASINPASPGGIIDPSRWEALGITAASEPNCAPVGNFSSIACAWLNEGGAALYSIVGGHAVENMGGSKASGRPALIEAAMKAANNTMQTTVKLLVRGNSTMFQRARVTLATVEGAQVTSDTGWTRRSESYTTSAQCDAGRCAYARDGKVVVSDPFNEFPGSGADPVPGGFSDVAPAPVRLASGKYAVVVRGANGHAYRAVTDGGFRWSDWVDEGGTLMPDARLSCIANGEQPLCFAQGLDGRIYWKKLGTASGF